MNQRVFHHNIVAGGLLGLALLTSAAPALGQGRGPASVVVSPVERREVSTWQSYVGTIYPLKKSAVGAAVDGRVTDFPVKVGDRVEAQAPLCQLLTRTIELQIEAARAELLLRDEELNELNAGSRPDEIAQALARRDSTKALRDFAKDRFERAAELIKRGNVITEEQYQESQSAYLAAEQNYRAADSEYRLVMDGPREEKKKQQVARVAAQQALVDQLEDQKVKHTMKAPFAGYIVAEGTEVGEWVSRAQVVAEVVFLDEVEIEAHVLDSQIDFVRAGQSATVEVGALASSSGTAFYRGTVTEVSPQADTRTRTFPVRIRVPNVIRKDKSPELKAGMIARVALTAGSLKEAVLVPKDSIVLGAGSPKVYGVIKAPPGGGGPGGGAPKAAAAKAAPADKKPADEAPALLAKPIPVELGLTVGDQIAVTGDLAGIEQVVVLGNERLMPFPTPIVISGVRKPVVDVEVDAGNAPKNESAPARP